MAMLTQAQIGYLAKLMEERHEREKREIIAVEQRAREQLDEGVAADPLDVALATTSLAAGDAVINQDVEDVRDIEAARGRMAAGIYGICTDCGKAIAYERLLVYPTAERCIHCQRLYEQEKAFTRDLRAD